MATRKNGKPRRGAPHPAPVRPGRVDPAARGTLVIVGGREDKEGDRLILRLVVDRARRGKVVVATVASEDPDALWHTYQPLFRALGAREVAHLRVGAREDARTAEALAALDGAAAVFFTGGDQLRITSQIGDTPVYERIREIYVQGGVVAGTSAGASVMCETMLVSGNGSESARVGGSLRMAPGLGLLPGVIVDQHFAERGRIGRLVAAVAQNPRILGVGIDENTAVVVTPDASFDVVGDGAVYVVDGEDLVYTNLAEEEQERALSVFGVRLHILSMGDAFDLVERRPANRPAEEMEREIPAPRGAGKGNGARNGNRNGNRNGKRNGAGNGKAPARKGARAARD
jgi:cyanophycinase